MFYRIFLFCLILNGIVVSGEEPVIVEDPGFTMFRDNCRDCHLTSGMGIREMNAPSIAGLPRWYVTDQLREFRREERGFDEGDYADNLMQIKAKTLNERDLAFVGRFIESMAPNANRSTLGLVAAPEGKKIYVTDCAECHGAEAGGGKRERAPPLNRQPDWYLLKQLTDFRAGTRQHGREAIVNEPSEPLAGAIVAWLASIPVVESASDQ